jgi:hypothetical protein
MPSKAARGREERVMAHVTEHEQRDRIVRREEAVVVADEVVDATAPVGPIARMIALVTSAVMTGVGAVALVQIDWSNGGFDAPSVEVLDIPFAPATAVATALLGLLAIAVSVGRIGEGRVVMGAILTTIGLAIVIADGGPTELELTDRLGWFTAGIGVILLLAGLASSGRLATRRTERRVDAY